MKVIINKGKVAATGSPCKTLIYFYAHLFISRLQTFWLCSVASTTAHRRDQTEYPLVSVTLVTHYHNKRKSRGHAPKRQNRANGENGKLLTEWRHSMPKSLFLHRTGHSGARVTHFYGRSWLLPTQTHQLPQYRNISTVHLDSVFRPSN